MRTAKTIEEAKERAPISSETATNKSGDRRGKHGHPNSLANLVSPWKPGQSGNPGGRLKDRAAAIAQQVIENNEEILYRKYTEQALTGNAYLFDVLANRAYGKMKETIEHTGLEALAERINLIRKRENGDSAT